MRSDARRSLGPALLAALLLAGGSGCSTRDHANPFDPENPRTHGRPRLLTAVAGDNVVHLTWSRERIDDLAWYRLERRGSDGRVVVLGDTLPVSLDAWEDTGALNDSTYDYALNVAFTGRADLVETPAVRATPGRRVLWVLEGRNGNPLQISPDGRSVLGRRGETSPGRFDVDPLTGDVITADVTEERLEKYAPDGTRLLQEGYPRLVALALLSPGAGAWVSATNPGRMTLLGPDLRTVLKSDTLSADLRELAVDRRTGDLWGSDVANARVFHRRKDGGLTAVLGFDFPLALAVDPVDGDCWVADRRAGEVLRVDARADTILFRVGGFEAPIDLAADAAGRGVWITDASRGEVVHLGADGEELLRLRGFGRPYGIATDPNGSDIWITDAQTDELLRYGVDGTLRERLGGLFSPFAVAVAAPPRGVFLDRVGLAP